MKTTRQIYGQYLLSSPVNYTGTNLADHVESLDHNSVYRYLKDEHLTPTLIWEQVKPDLVMSDNGYLMTDDTVLSKKHAFQINGVRRQYSGNEHGIVKGIVVVNLLYYNPEHDRFWVIDYRVFDPERDGKTKRHHLNEMLNSVNRRQIRYRTMLMDTWYATMPIMTRLSAEKKIVYCPIKKNRLVDETGGEAPYRAVETLTWTDTELQTGKLVKLYKFKMNTKLKLFRVTVVSELSPNGSIGSDRTDYLVTNELTQSDTHAAQEVSAKRWKIEQFHREEKQLTGIGNCECRLNRSQRNHICIAMLVWTQLKKLADHTHKTVYQLKHNVLSDYLIPQLKHPTIRFT
jgi:SRSO17 transposase